LISSDLAVAAYRESDMMKNVGAIAAGFVIWILTSVVAAFVSIYIWEHSPDRYASVALQSWIGTTLALIIAVLAKERIAPPMSDRTFVVILGGVILLWVAIPLISGFDDFRMIALAAHALAIGIAGWRAHEMW
jgi:hypothetical protein